MIDAAVVLLAVALLLVVVGGIQPLAARLRLPPVVLLAAFGIAIGVASSVLPRDLFDGAAQLLSGLPISSEAIIYVFLPLLVFEAGITSDVRRILEDAAPILLLAIVATLITTATIGFALWPFAGVPLVVCLLLGSVVATTDPAAVIAVFRDVGAPARLTRLVEGEALLNDAAAIVLFVVLLGMLVGGHQPDVAAGAREFIVSFFGGAALGVVAARVLLYAIGWLGGDRLAEASFGVALAYLAFIAGERLFHVSGIVTVLAAALSTRIRENAEYVEGDRAWGERGDRFMLSRRFDRRWSIVDAEAGYQAVVFCPDATEARLILAALNAELPRRAKRTSTPDHS